MTREEAIRILDPVTTGEALAEIEYYNGFSGKTAAVQAVSDACVLAVAALREQGERRWIPVTERLPDWRDGKVLVFTKYGFSICERTVNNMWRGQHANWITHWTYLPQPPKEETP